MRRLAHILPLLLCACAGEGTGKGFAVVPPLQVPSPDGGVDRFDVDGAPRAPRPDRGVGGPPPIRDAGPDDLDSGGDSPPADAATPDPDGGMPPPPPDDLPPDPGVNAGWIGGPCEEDADCDYEEAFCLQEAEGYPRGLCSLGCDRLCPDRDGLPTTFCVDEVVVGQGACIQQCDYDAFPIGCRPGYHCENRSRHGEPGVRRGVCVPGAPEEPPDGFLDCYDEMDAAGLDYQRTNNPMDHPGGREDLVCDIEGPIRLSSPIGGVNYRYVSHDEPRPMFMSCHLANALVDLAALLRERDVVEVGHIGTYNCRTLRGGDSISQHGLGLAIDLAWFRTADGVVYNLEDHWEHDTQDFQTAEGRWLYELGWQMHTRRVFNVVLTPNFDAGHDNHFHVDLTPGSHFIGRSGHWSGCFAPNPHGD